MQFKMSLLLAMLPLGACGTIHLPMRQTVLPPPPPPLVIAPACLIDPVAPGTVAEPPMPPPLERPAGAFADHPADWYAYDDRRRERAELAGLFFQGERDAIAEAYETNAATQRACVAWAKEH